jgi:sarcosine oxidase
VVGAGVFGASLADVLSTRGWRVTLVDRYGPANWRSSSGDHSRLLRCGHLGGDGNDEWYTRSAWRARALWRQIAEEEDQDLIVKTGAIWFSTDLSGGEGAAEATMREAGVPCGRLSPADLRDQFPDINADDLAVALFEPEACVLRAAECVRVMVRRSCRRGARFLYGTAAPHPRGVLVDGQLIQADREIWACGAWLGKLFPRWAPVQATRQHVFYWDAPPAWRRGPAWVENSSGFYGFPDFDGVGIKALSDRIGPPLDLESAVRELDPQVEGEVQRYLAHRFPALDGIKILRAYVMHYEVTPGRTFLAGPTPGQTRVWLLGGGSGHGFKHGPALGTYLADVLDGVKDLEPRFAISR